MLKILRGIPGKLFEILYKMCLVKEVVFITDLGQRLFFTQVIKHRIKPDNGRKFFRTSACDFPESFFEGALADVQQFVDFPDSNCAFMLINQFHCFCDKLICLDIF